MNDYVLAFILTTQVVLLTVFLYRLYKKIEIIKERINIHKEQIYNNYCVWERLDRGLGIEYKLNALLNYRLDEIHRIQLLENKLNAISAKLTEKG